MFSFTNRIDNIIIRNGLCPGSFSGTQTRKRCHEKRKVPWVGGGFYYARLKKKSHIQHVCDMIPIFDEIRKALRGFRTRQIDGIFRENPNGVIETNVNATVKLTKNYNIPNLFSKVCQCFFKLLL